ncbi:MAG: DUF4124 domain-containing protein, partial [Steroidobacteraceae bacterium]
MWLVCPVTLAATVYKWVDENGVVHYSDQPHPSAQKLLIEGAQTYPANHPPGDSAAPAQERQPGTVNSYARCTIAAPSAGQTLENANSVAVSVQTEPALRGADQVFL